MTNQQIITGFDGSEPSRAAARWAAREAIRRGLPLEVLQAWPWGPGRPLGTGQAERWGREQLAAEADTLRALFPGLDVRATHVPDDAVTVLAAASDRAALLVLGSRRLGPLRGFLAGSVSQQMLGRAGGPVVLVRAPAGADLRLDEEEKHGVTVGLDLAHPCDQVLDFAFAAAASRQDPLTVVRAWGPPPGTEYLHFGAIGGLEEQLAADERRALDTALAPWLERHPELPVTTETTLGHAGIVLVEAAARAGLLVIGARHRRNPVGAQLGPVAHAVIHHAPCPLAIVPVR